MHCAFRQVAYALCLTSHAHCSLLVLSLASRRIWTSQPQAVTRSLKHCPTVQEHLQLPPANRSAASPHGSSYYMIVLPPRRRRHLAIGVHVCDDSNRTYPLGCEGERDAAMCDAQWWPSVEDLPPAGLDNQWPSSTVTPSSSIAVGSVWPARQLVSSAKSEHA